MDIEIIIIPMPKNLTFQILADGYLKAQTLLDELMQKPFIRKKHENVIVKLENLLVYEKKIKQAYYDVDTSTVRLYLQEVKYLDENDE